MTSSERNFAQGRQTATMLAFQMLVPNVMYVYLHSRQGLFLHTAVHFVLLVPCVIAHPTEAAALPGFCYLYGNEACHATQVQTARGGTKRLPIFHNYGHGGAGITLHWGCAQDVVKLVQAYLAQQHTSRL